MVPVFQEQGCGIKEPKYEFTVAGDPQPQPRVKAARIGNGVRVYTPGTANLWKAQIVAAAQKAGVAGLELRGPLQLIVSFHLTKPKTVKRQYPAVKPDLDNYLKAVMDALTEARVWHDDSQVVMLYASKEYTPVYPHASIMIDELEADDAKRL